jgi:hypothetical protein
MKKAASAQKDLPALPQSTTMKLPRCRMGAGESPAPPVSVFNQHPTEE